MNKWKTARHWHNQIGLILALPMLIVGLTAIFIAHDKALGARKVVVSEGGEKGHSIEVKAVAMTSAGTLLGTKSGLWLSDGQQSRQVLPGVEVRDILMVNGVIWVAGKEGLWRGENGSYRQVSPVEAWQLNQDDKQRLWLVSKENGVQQVDSQSGALNTQEDVSKALAQLPREAEPYTLNKLVMDLHTGKALFGKAGEWIWIDVLGAVLVMLSITGTWMWAKARRQR
ncbi:MAG: PepSY domain-containing protein [Pseudogulbenkiania sp.]|nr:PepSY domain-containing protein [Pseudogulbenkiania sp.]